MPGVPLSHLAKAFSEEKNLFKLSLKKTPFSLKRIFFFISLLGVLLCLFFYFFQNPKPIVFLPTPYSHFVGRQEILQKLKKRIIHKPKKIFCSVALWGEGGIGKSETALHFANQHLKAFSLIYWINAGSEEIYQQSYLNLAHHLHIPLDQKLPFETILEKVHYFLENKKFHKPWLLIYDNVNRVIDLPKKGCGRVLITIKDKTEWEFFDCLQVPLFSEKESKKIFSQVMQKDPSYEWNALAAKLNHFPLALSQALHYVKESPNVTITDYNNLLEETKGVIFKYKTSHTRYSNHLLALWQIGMNALKSTHSKAYEWLQICAYLHPDKIPIDWVELWLIEQENSNQSCAKLEASEILRTLINRGYITLNKETQSFSIHRLKQKLLQHTHENIDKMKEKALVLLSDQVKNFQYHDKLEWEWSKEVWEKLSNWETSATWWLEKNHSTLPDSHEQAILLNVLGNLNVVFKAKYQKGLELYRQAQAIQERIDPEGKSSSMIFTLLNQAFCFYRLGQYDTSEQLCKQTIGLVDHLYPNIPTPFLGYCLNSLTCVLSWKGDHTAALKYCEKALEIQTMLYPLEDHPEICESIKWLGNIWHILGDAEKGLHYTLKALQMNKRLFGEKTNIQRSHILNNLGLLYSTFGEVDCALECHLQVLQMDKEIFPLASSIPVLNLEYIATDYRLKKKYSKSISYIKKALKLIDEYYPNHLHLHWVEGSANLGAIYLEWKKPKKAFPHYQEALEKAGLILKNKNLPVFSRIYRGLGRSYCQMGKRNQGIKYLEEALRIRRELYSDQHSLLFPILQDLGEAYQGHDPQKATEYFSWAAKVNRTKPLSYDAKIKLKTLQ